jgi:hypothetical protein
MYMEIGGWADADIVDDDWLVCEDILVFGGHSTLGEGEGMDMGCVGEFAVGVVELTVQLSLASSDASVVFLKSANHDGQTSFDISQLYPPPLLNLFGAVLFVFCFPKHCHTHAWMGLLAPNSRCGAQ